MVYGINNQVSFENLKVFHEQLVTFRKRTNVPLVLVGNKCDMENSREVKKEDGAKRAKEFNANFFETSAKKDTNVTTIFEHLARKLYDIRYESEMKRKSKSGKNEVEDMKCICLIF